MQKLPICKTQKFNVQLLTRQPPPMWTADLPITDPHRLTGPGTCFKIL